MTEQKIPCPRAWHIEKKGYFEVKAIRYDTEPQRVNIGHQFDVELDEVILEWPAGRKDKNGKMIHQGDILELRFPYRSGEYPELMEPEIKIVRSPVIFADGQFTLQCDKIKADGQMKNEGFAYVDSLYYQLNRKYDRDTLIEIYQMNKDDLWDDEDEGFLQYLLRWYTPKSEKDLIEYLEAVEIAGNVNENPELSKVIKGE